MYSGDRGTSLGHLGKTQIYRVATRFSRIGSFSPFHLHTKLTCSPLKIGTIPCVAVVAFDAATTVQGPFPGDNISGAEECAPLLGGAGRAYVGPYVVVRFRFVSHCAAH